MNAASTAAHHTPRTHSACGVLVLGEALVDSFASGMVPGGAPFNVARSLAVLGVPVTLITRIGESDEAGSLVLTSARQFGLSLTGFQRDPQHPTGIVTVEQNGASHRFVIHDGAAWDHIDLEQARTALVDMAAQLVYFGSLAQRSAGSRNTLRALLRETRALRYLDLNLRDGPDNLALSKESLDLADWLKVNDEELDQLLMWFVHPGQSAPDWGTPAHQRALRALMDKFQLQRMVVTRGEQGYASFNARADIEAEGAAEPGVQLVDTVGAGDAFSAVTLATQLTGWHPQPALALANRYAAAICAQRGPLPQSQDFFDPWRLALGYGSVSAKAPIRSYEQ
jgi:fructokinase